MGGADTVEPSSGIAAARIIVRHILGQRPGSDHHAAESVGGSRHAVESALSFLGPGSLPPAPSWGSMLADGRTFILTCAHIGLFPGLAITFAILAFNLLGGGVRDALDPRTRS